MYHLVKNLVKDVTKILALSLEEFTTPCKNLYDLIRSRSCYKATSNSGVDLEFFF